MKRDSKYSLPAGPRGPAAGSRKSGKAKKAPKQPQKPAAGKRAIPRQQTTFEIAEIFDVHEKTVRQWIADKCPADRRKRIFYLNDGEVQNWLTETGRKTTPGRPAEEKIEMPSDLGGDKDYWLARKYKRQCLENEGSLIAVQDVKRWISETITTAKNKLIGLGAALASVLEGRDEAERQTIIDKRVNEILDELSAAAAGVGGRMEAA